MTLAKLAVRWITADGPCVRATLAAALSIKASAGGSISIPGLRLELVPVEPGTGTRAADRLEVAAARPHSAQTRDADDPTPAPGAWFVALGWATVDLDRMAASQPGVRWAAAPRDSLATATAVLLQPDTEGRLAAALARRGEGPAVLYVGLPAPAIAGARTRLARLGVRVWAGTGPFGAALAVADAPASSPTLIVVTAPGPDTTSRPAEDRRGTIGS